ncbi:MAG: hypothetical protein AABZ10_01755 [Nitrospirota bacterium]
MKNFFLPIIYVGGLLLIIFILPGSALSQYRISGVVEFTYRNLETKTGNSVSSNPYWTQTYRANLQGDVLDPRFMTFSGGAGYSVYTYKNAGNSSIVDYNLNTSFFPGMKVSWNLFGSKSVTTFESTALIAGYDVTTTTYGATLNLRLGSRGKSNNNWSNASGNSGTLLPDITLSRIHSESESLGTVVPLRETRDDTRASLNYRFSSLADLHLDGAIEQYENQVSNSSYETKTASLLSNVRVSPGADLKLSGRVTDRQTDNVAGYNPNETIWAYNMTLDFKEKNGMRHYYMYDFSEQKSPTFDYKQQRAMARVVQKIREDWRIQGGVDYSLSDYVREPDTLIPGGEKSRLETGGLLGGVAYTKKYTPAFLGPFTIDTNYDFTTGFSKLSSETGGTEGGGAYYTNNVGLGIGSSGWKNETLSLFYNYTGRRDHSPVANDAWQHAYRFTVSTQRIPRTAIRGSVYYTTQENKSEAGNIHLTTQTFSNQQVTVNQQRRAWTYDLTAEHTVSTYLNLTAGASRGQTASTYYTLSTLPSLVNTDDTFYYGTANVTYPLTRHLVYRAQVREDYRKSATEDAEGRQVNMFLDYRIRQIFVTVEYRWRQDIPQNTLRTEQQYYYVKLSRPF